MLISFKIVPAKDKLITVLGNFFGTSSALDDLTDHHRGKVCIFNFYKQNFERTVLEDGNMLESDGALLS